MLATFGSIQTSLFPRGFCCSRVYRVDSHLNLLLQRTLGTGQPLLLSESNGGRVMPWFDRKLDLAYVRAGV